jgi:hypothetical protein
MSGAIPLVPLCALMACTGTPLPFSLFLSVLRYVVRLLVSVGY